MQEMTALIDKNRQGTTITASVPIVGVVALESVEVELNLDLQKSNPPATVKIYQSEDAGVTWAHVADITWGGGHVPFDDELNRYVQPTIFLPGAASGYVGKMLRAEVSNLDPMQYAVKVRW